MDEVISKKLIHSTTPKGLSVGEIEIVEETLLSKPISLRFWSSFFVILPIFFQAPWVRFNPLSALLFTFLILALGIYLTNKLSKKFFIVGSLLLGVSGSWLGGCLFWGWLSSHPILHIPVEAVVLPIAIFGLGTKWKIGSSFYLSSLFGTAVTDITIFFTGIMDKWMEVVNADPEEAPLILQKTSEDLIQFQSILIITIFGVLLWFLSKIILNSATLNSSNGISLLVSSYVLQTTLIVDGIFFLLAVLQPSLSGLV